MNNADVVNCGLCEKSFETRENLETHLNTCEIYRCTKCENKETTLPKLDILMFMTVKNTWRLAILKSAETTVKMWHGQTFILDFEQQKSPQIKHAFFFVGQIGVT